MKRAQSVLESQVYTLRVKRRHKCHHNIMSMSRITALKSTEYPATRFPE